jgi:hypothetical protein
MSEGRRFHEDFTHHIPPMDYRLKQGRKGDGDLRLDWRWNDGKRISPWRPVELEHVALILDAIADNENILFPPPASGSGKVVKFVRQVFTEGWRQANHDLHLERNLRHDRDVYDPPAS